MNHFQNADQLIVPFAEREYVTVPRAARILNVGASTVHRLASMHDHSGRALLHLVNYRRNAHKRILYSSIVYFCDGLREKFGIADRRPKLDHPMFRHRDEDLLPFRLSDTIYMYEALRALGYENYQPVKYLIEEGRFDAYQILAGSAWRISKVSLVAFLAKTRDSYVLPQSSHR